MDTFLPDSFAVAALQTATCAAWPAPPLRAFVSHYWLCRGNAQTRHMILADGAVDVVIALEHGTPQIDVFGTTTTRVDVPLARGGQYLGIRFRPGQARHFVDVPAVELTDAHVPARDALDWRLDGVVDALPSEDVFARIDAILLAQIDRRSPARQPLDAALVALARGSVSVHDAARASGLGLRQFERRVLAATGLAPKLFADIARFQRAAEALARTRHSLADIAAAAGYADQSHFTRAFTRFAGMPPAAARRDVAFVQDPTRTPAHTAASFNATMGWTA